MLHAFAHDSQQSWNTRWSDSPCTGHGERMWPAHCRTTLAIASEKKPRMATSFKGEASHLHSSANAASTVPHDAGSPQANRSRLVTPPACNLQKNQLILSHATLPARTTATSKASASHLHSSANAARTSCTRWRGTRPCNPLRSSSTHIWPSPFLSKWAMICESGSKKRGSHTG